MLDEINLTVEPSLNSYTISHNKIKEQILFFMEYNYYFLEIYFHINSYHGKKYTFKGGHFPFSKGNISKTFSWH